MSNFLKFLLSILFMAYVCTLSPYSFAEDRKEFDFTGKIFNLAKEKRWDDALYKLSNSSDSALLTLTKWRYLVARDSDPGFYETVDFLNKYPDWPLRDRILVKAERAIFADMVDKDMVIKWLTANPPITGVGKMALADAMLKKGGYKQKDIKKLVEEAWIYGDFNNDEEKYLLSRFAKFLSDKDDIKRTDRLLWEGKIISAKHMLDRLPKKYANLYKTRMYLMLDKRGVSKMLRALPASMRNDSGIIYERMRYRDRRKDEKGVREMLLGVSGKVPYPEKWWYYRKKIIYSAISKGDMKLALRLASKHGQVDGASQADAEWIKGWLLLRYGNNAGKAASIFERMFDKVGYPISKSRFAYWAGRAYQKIGKSDKANSCFKKAANYPTTFYGQLAIKSLGVSFSINSDDNISINSRDREKFYSRDIVKAAIVSLNYGEEEIADYLLGHLVMNAASKEEAALASEIGVKYGKLHISVRSSRKAMLNNIILLDKTYPILGLYDEHILPPELVHSIIRQESEFNREITSSAGARGLMQVMPATARHTARKSDIKYSKDRLYDEDYNINIGSLYLSRMLDNYDGSLILAIAAYNAGPGNVNKWIKQMGRPTGDINSRIDWIEKIPFSETRNYVQRVLENLQLYRHIIKDGNFSDKSNGLRIEEDLLL
ncbi:MAG: lytic transglycosylase domain-containing protein [Rickettsiales bacterium]